MNNTSLIYVEMVEVETVSMTTSLSTVKKLTEANRSMTRYVKILLCYLAISMALNLIGGITWLLSR